MSEGAYLPWKVQAIDKHRGPAVGYDQLHRPLPPPPKDMQWVQDPATRDWRLDPKVVKDIVATAEWVGDSNLQSLAFHEIQSEDTLEGICLRYNLSPTELRQANGGFMGTNLGMAPNPLQIPNEKDTGREGTPPPNYTSPRVVVVAVSAIELLPAQKILQLLRSCPKLSESEAKCYLEMNDWNVNEAFLNAREDGF